MFISICYYRNNKTIFCILQITCFILSIPNFVISKILALVIVIGETEGAYVDRDPQTGYMKLAEKKRLGWFAVIYCIIAGITLFGMICYKFDS